jgi:peptidoglycan/LPS O-acetylase OafA/YrhL
VVNNSSVLASPKQMFWMLHGFRGVAAICVMLMHYGVALKGVGLNGVGLLWLGEGYLAVDFFFILSGFIIACNYDAKMEAGMGVFPFLRQRLARLYPIYFLGITLPVLVFGMHTAFWPHDYAFADVIAPYWYNIIFIPSPYEASLDYNGFFSLNIVAWTLSLELGVNILYALLYPWLKGVVLKRLLVVSGALLVMFSYVFESVDLGAGWEDYEVGWYRVSWGFFSGVWLARQWRLRPRKALPGRAGVFLGALLVIQFSLPENLFFPLFSVLVVMPGIVWWGAHVQLQGRGLAVARWLGNISYTLYMMHMVLFYVYQRTDLTFGAAPGSAPHIGLPPWGILSVLAAWAISAWYDTPMRRLITRRRSILDIS